jgi:predicted O-linked N-acetylglucosamine transferase (SPINDLY family)
MHLCQWDELSSQLQELRTRINNNEKVIGSFPLMGLIDDPSLQKKASEIFVNHHYPESHILPELTRYSKHSKIRVGYLSADFKIHPTAFLTAELYELHDREQFEIHAFSFGPDTNDEMNLRIKAGVDHFHNVREMSHKDLAMFARSLEIDIAVDLGGYTGSSRPKVFAMRAAPLQVNYLVFPGTMCASYIEYIIADHILIPKNKQKHYSEKIVYMPNSYQVNIRNLNISDRVLSRDNLGLSSNNFVFCCFNNAYKITPEIFSSWMRILHKVQGSELWLLTNNNVTLENLKKEATNQGINKNRLVFASYVSISKHLNRIKHADLFLDTRPYNAHTTSSDALRMGIPVLTCIGKSFPSRVAASILNSVNLPELIADTQEEYESLAIELATNPIKLKNIKDKLINNLSTAPLFDTPLFTRNLESAYKTMYEKHHSGMKPEHIFVD